MSWTWYASDLHAGPVQFLVLGLILSVAVGCGTPDTESGTGAGLVTWTPIDSLNATLPETVRVSAGRNDTIPLRAWHVRVDDPGRTPVDVLRADDADGAETVSQVARDADACVAVNAGYFDMSATPRTPVGLLVVDEATLAPPTDTVRRGTIPYPVARGALGVTDDGTPDVAWTSHRRDTLWQWVRPPRHRPGTPAPMPPRTAARHWSVDDAVGAGPVLVVAGTTAVSADAEVFFGTSIPDVHPRTAAGVTPDGALLLVVVDGRQDASRGVSLDDLARIMRGLGAEEAVNLDGGGSSALVVNGHLLNRPTGGTTERAVASAVVVRCREGSPS